MRFLATLSFALLSATAFAQYPNQAVVVNTNATIPQVLRDRCSPMPGSTTVNYQANQVRIVWSEPMDRSTTQFVAPNAANFPTLRGNPYWQDDYTFVLPVRLSASRTYSIPITGTAFRSQAGVDARPGAFQFQTLGVRDSSNARGVSSGGGPVARTTGNTSTVGSKPIIGGSSSYVPAGQSAANSASTQFATTQSNNNANTNGTNSVAPAQSVSRGRNMQRFTPRPSPTPKP